MAFVKFYSLLTDYYFPEHQIVEMQVVPSDDVDAGAHMTKVRFVEGFEIEEETFYGEPVFV